MTQTAPALLQGKKNQAFDVDDCLFDRTNGIHQAIKYHIVDTFNKIAAKDPRFKAQFIDTVQHLDRQNDFDIDAIQPTDLEAAFLPIVLATKACFGSDFYTVLDQYYAVDYSVIAPNPTLVEAFNAARNKDMGVYLYTNGPSHPHTGEELHVQRVLKRLGFDQDWIEYLRPRTHDLLNSTFLGNGKPYTDSFVQMLNRFDLDPRETVFYDDTVPNLETAAKLGIATVWPWLTDAATPTDLEQRAQAINAIKTRDTAKTFMLAIDAYTPQAG